MFNKISILAIATIFISGCWGGGGSSGSSKNASFVVDTSVSEILIPDYDDVDGDVVVINGTATISWIAPTRNDDASDENPIGTRLTHLDGFKIYYSQFPGEYLTMIAITNIGLSSYLIENLGEGDWFFVMTAYNTYGNESKYSKEVFKEIK